MELGNRLGTVVLAVACILAMSATASAIDSVVTTTPDDAIDIDPGSLPVSDEDAANLEDAVKGEEGSADEGTGGSRQVGDGDPEAGSAESDAGESEPEQREAEIDGDRVQPQAAEEEAPQPKRSGGGSQQEKANAQTGVATESLLERILDLLRDLLAALLAALPYLALLAAVALAVAFRDRIADRIRPYLPERGSETDAGVGDPAPQHGIDEAWTELLRAIDRTRDAKMTPSDCAEEAIERGYDPEAVWTLTNIYEEVRYGAASATPERERTAWDTVERLRGGEPT
jgi:hypothetical protein